MVGGGGRTDCGIGLVLQGVLFRDGVDVDLNLGVSEFLQNLLLLDFFVDDGPIIFYGKFFVVIGVQFEIDLGLLDLHDLFMIVKLLQIGVLQDLLDSDSLARIELQHSGNEIHEFGVVHWDHFLPVGLSFHIQHIDDILIYLDLHVFEV